MKCMWNEDNDRNKQNLQEVIVSLLVCHLAVQLDDEDINRSWGPLTEIHSHSMGQD